MLHLVVFDIGSIVGILLLSALVGLPFALTTRKLTGINFGVQTLAGILSIAFGSHGFLRCGYRYLLPLVHFAAFDDVHD